MSSVNQGDSSISIFARVRIRRLVSHAREEKKEGFSSNFTNLPATNVAIMASFYKNGLYSSIRVRRF